MSHVSAGSDESSPAESSLPLLQDRNFLLFFSAFSVSTLGTATIPVAITFALLGSGYPASAVGLVIGAQTAPIVLLMLAGGVVGDRWARRHLMIAADLLRCCTQATLATLLATGHPGLPVLLGLAACGGIGTAFYGPAESGVLPQLAGLDRLKRVNSVLNLSGSLMAIVGPALGGVLVGFGGASVAIGLDAASYAVSATCISLVHIAHHSASRRSSLLDDLKSGWSEFNRHRWLQLVTVQQGVLNLLAFAPFFVLGPMLFSAVQNGARTWGIIASATGAGGIVGGLLVLRVHVPRPILVVQLAIALLATPLVLLALHASVILLVIGSGVFGVALAVVNILVQTSLQESIPNAVLSRVASIYSLAAMGLGPIGFAMSGYAAEFFGAEDVLSVGAASLLVSVALVLTSSDVRRFERHGGTHDEEPLA
ncbi:MFS transporter [Rhodopila sp.]|uniref:MFS transporter n=1 Tax=Rhodopila sp. TaxID=2480087 RepID=UPI003D1309FB